MSTKNQPASVTQVGADFPESMIYGGTEDYLTNQANDAAQANLQMDREFYDQDADSASAEAVDLPQMFRSES